MRLVFTIILASQLAMGIAQPLPDRYRTEIFEDVTKTDEVLFSENVPQPEPGGGFYEFITGLPLNVDEFNTSQVDLYMDIYAPEGDTLTSRPAVVICFGGGFLDGSKDHWSIVLIAEALARRGFVAAAIDYRLGMNIFDEDLTARAVYRGVQDGRAAVKYLRTNAATLGIDPDQIFIGGHSSGAFIALHNLYLDQESERPASTFEWMQEGIDIPDLGCLDCTGVDNELSGHADAAFNLAGAIGFLSYVEHEFDGRTVSFHSEDDGTVPYEIGEPFSDVAGLILGEDLPTVYGSHPFSLRCDTLSLPDSLYSYTNRGHGVHEAPGDSLYPDIMPGIGSWFYSNRLRPDIHPLTGDSVICMDQLATSFMYSVEAGDAIYFDWQIEGGVLLGSSTSDSAAEVTWIDTAVQHMIAVTPYNSYLARGATMQILIDLVEPGINNWSGGSGLWTDPANWSLGRVPTLCDQVVLEHTGPELNVEIPSQKHIEIRSAEIIGDVIVQLGGGTFFRVQH